MQQTNLAIIVVGAGNVGGYWLDNFAPKLPANAEVIAIVRSRRYLTDGLEPINNWRQAFSKTTEHSPVDARAMILKQLEACSHPHKVVLDLTADEQIRHQYGDWIAAGAHIISANKYAGASSNQDYQKLRKALHHHQRQWLANTTVGAGLPIQAAIQERLRGNDTIHKISGLCSGSLSWILRQFQASDKPFSYWVKQASELGYTEPDPRQDLGGHDVARKLTILAREAGWTIEPASIQLQSLVPQQLREVQLEQFWQQLDEIDAYLKPWLETDASKPMDYLGTVALVNGQLTATAELTSFAVDSLFATVRTGDSAFQIFSDHYSEGPLTVQGPGVGAALTASGVHSDVLTLVKQLMS
ncbi:MAG: aspartate kinase [Idiomarina sp.]